MVLVVKKNIAPIICLTVLPAAKDVLRCDARQAELRRYRIQFRYDSCILFPILRQRDMETFRRKSMGNYQPQGIRRWVGEHRRGINDNYLFSRSDKPRHDFFDPPLEFRPFSQIKAVIGDEDHRVDATVSHQIFEDALVMRGAIGPLWYAEIQCGRT